VDVSTLRVTPITEQTAEVSFIPRGDLGGYHRNTQVVIYAIVTALARLSLTDTLRRLMGAEEGVRARLFYCDTGESITDTRTHTP